MAIQAISFGRTETTQKGNEYKKTHAGTIAGTIAGLGFGAADAYAASKKPLIKKITAQGYSRYKELMPKEAAAKYAKLTLKCGFALGVAMWVLAGLGAGALVNKVINKGLANNADKKAAAQETK